MCFVCEYMCVCVRVHVCACMCECVTMKRKCLTNGNHDKQYRRYVNQVAASTTQTKIQQEKVVCFISRTGEKNYKLSKPTHAAVNLYLLDRDSCVCVFVCVCVCVCACVRACVCVCVCVSEKDER